MQSLGHENTYTFSKAVTEHLIHRESKLFNNISCHIVRPSIVGPAYSFPHPAWHPRDKATTMVAAIGIEKIGRFMWDLNENNAGVVPVDVVTASARKVFLKHFCKLV